MDVTAKARRSQALIDSIEELIALERDVSLATDSCPATNGQPQQVMVPLTEVAFMPGTIAGGSVMVGLGQDYYVERTPKEAQAVLQRRIADLSGQARVLEEGALLVPPSPPPAPEKSQRKPRRRKKQGGSDNKMAWGKGFLSAGSERPTRSQAPSAGRTVPAKVGEEKVPDDDPSTAPTEIQYNDSEGHEHVVELEDGGEEPIMEIREWLDESGNQTSVDVTDLGKVLHTAPKAAKAKLRSTADADTMKAGPAAAVAAASPDKPHPGSESSSSDLDSVFARLEEQEERAEKDAASPSLGPQWKKGFLDGGTKRPARAPSAATPRAQETKQAAEASAVAARRGDETTRQKANGSAFRETVVEKAHVVPGFAGSSLEEKAPVAPARVSRFKARRQGL